MKTTLQHNGSNTVDAENFNAHAGGSNNSCGGGTSRIGWVDGTWWFVSLVALLAACSPEEPDADPTGTLEVAVTDPTAELNPTYPGQPGRLQFSVRMEFSGSAPDSTTVSGARVELVGLAGTVKDGLAVQFLEGADLRTSVEVPASGYAGEAQISGLLNNAAAELCGGLVHARLTLHATHCDCETEAAFDFEPRCYLDNRGDTILAMTRNPAPDRPCERTMEVSGAVARERYGYDAAGRLQIRDAYVGTILQTRMFYRYAENGFLSETWTVEPSRAVIYRRRTYEYAGATLSRSTVDGAADEATKDPDGVPETETTYTLSAGRWEIHTLMKNTGGGVAGSVTFDLTARTYSGGEPGSEPTNGVYDNTVNDPNVFVALPNLEMAFALRLRTVSSASGEEVYSWSGERLQSISVSNASGVTATANYLYTCP